MDSSENQKTLADQSVNIEIAIGPNKLRKPAVPGLTENLLVVLHLRFSSRVTLVCAMRNARYVTLELREKLF